MLRFPPPGDWAADLAEREASWETDVPMIADRAELPKRETIWAAFACWVGFGTLIALALVVL